MLDEDPGILDGLWRAMAPQAAMRGDIRELRSRLQDSERSKTRAGMDQSRRIEALERDLGELELLCRALLTVLQEKAGMKWEDILSAMKAIDAEDGVIDGRVTPPTEVKPLPDPRLPRRRPLA